jgi:hypothetical protein
MVFRSRTTQKLFRKLDEKKATGGDMISAAILKRLCECLTIPFTIVVRRLFFAGCWPKVWKRHLICPIFKRGAAFKPDDYRGIHLTTILSKVAERFVGIHLVPVLQRTAFGDSQWAFSKGLSSRDLVSMSMMSFILAVCTDKTIGRFLSDISCIRSSVQGISFSKVAGFWHRRDNVEISGFLFSPARRKCSCTRSIFQRHDY